MKKRILEYTKRIDSCLSGETEVSDWKALLEEHLVQIGFFQHERLIHLLVTLVFGILTVATIIVVALTGYIKLLVLAGGLLILLIPYIMHYYLLENEVQKMYGQYDEILKKL
ncbi:MAG: hypothetical protein K6A74_06205 [Lachnospiraceae bacterium]|nr:hypothetical protein [Lachnospiraceae bacterium]